MDAQLKPHTIYSEKQYWDMVHIADTLSEIIGLSETHPLLDFFELTCDCIRAYDLAHLEVPDASNS
jgi:hypothetical protein